MEAAIRFLDSYVRCVYANLKSMPPLIKRLYLLNPQSTLVYFNY